MNLKTIFDTISTEECLGYAPVSGSTKPAHIANGWFRRLIGKAYDPVLLNNTIIHWVGSREENPNDLYKTMPTCSRPFCHSTNVRYL